MSILSEHGGPQPINDADGLDQIQIFYQCPYYRNWLGKKSSWDKLCCPIKSTLITHTLHLFCRKTPFLVDS